MFLLDGFFNILSEFVYSLYMFFCLVFNIEEDNDKREKAADNMVVLAKVCAFFLCLESPKLSLQFTFKR